MRYFSAYGPAAPPRQDLVTALQQKMLVLGYTPTPGWIYGEAEQVVVDSYANQIGLAQDDRDDLNGVIAAILPVMDSDIEVGGMWRPPNGGGTITADQVNITGRPPGSTSSMWGLGLLALIGLFLWQK